MARKKQVTLLIFLISILIAVNYSFIDNNLQESFKKYEGGVVEKVIDGDTIVVNNISIRLLGINSPERGEDYYNEARKYLSALVMNKNVKFKFGKDKYDLYNRMLAYIIFDEENVNLKLVEGGFANFYFPSGKDVYYPEFRNAWENCILKNKNLCEKSKNKCANCISLENLDYKNEIVEFENKCSFDCELSGWEIKDEGRKTFYFPEFILEENKKISVVVGDGENNEEKLFWKNKDYVWTDSGDTLFLRDEKGKLVLWRNY